MRRPRPAAALTGASTTPASPATNASRTSPSTANPAINPAVIDQLATCAWVKAGHPLCLIGDSGTGKTHLLIAPGHRRPPKPATGSATPWPASWSTNSSKPPTTSSCPRPSPATAASICSWLDELGYLQLDRRGAELLFQVLTEREERSAIAIATNEPFSGWTKTFTDPRLCAAIVDRLTFAGQIIETGTTCYRLGHSRKKRSVASSRPD